MAGLLLEYGIEILGRSKAAITCDVADIVVGIGEELECFLYPPPLYPIRRRQSGRTLENAEDPRTRVANMFSKLGYVYFSGKVCLEPIDCRFHNV